MGFHRLLQRLRWTFGRELWIRPALASLFSILMAVFSYWVGSSYEGKVNLAIDESSLTNLFGIFASSMLTVATFTVTAIMAAASSAATSTTPRASGLILSDNKAQLVLSAFIAAFIYSICGIISLKAFAYGQAGRFLLFVGLIVIVSFVLVSFVNWVDHAMKLGRQVTVIDKLTEATLDMITPENVGTWGARVGYSELPEGALPICGPRVGYLHAIDVEGLSDWAEENGLVVHLLVRPGDSIDTATPFAAIEPAPAILGEHLARHLERIASCLEIDASRDYMIDVRFGFVTLAETADRALSPGINDPGTAIAILGRQLEVMTRWAEVRKQVDALPKFERVYMPALTAEEVMRDCFTAISRDGAGAVEVGIRLQKTLAAIARLGEADMTIAAGELSRCALVLAENALIAEAHKDLVRKAAAQVAKAVAGTDENPATILRPSDILSRKDK
ncbi:MAG: DUF2254 domain-containing protein [Hyphomicrobiaceae bacterium]